MGIDASHIVKNNFRDIENKEASKLFVETHYKMLCEKLGLIPSSDDVRYDVFEGYQFKLPVYAIEFNTHKGMWRMESYFHYCRIVMYQEDIFALRFLISDIVRALGEKEVWHAEEYYTWNGGLLEEQAVTFEDWLTDVKKRNDGQIPEYDYDEIMRQGDEHILDYESIYHDNLKECDDKFRELTEKLKSRGYQLLGIAPFYNGCLRCKFKGKIVLVDYKTLDPVFGENCFIEETIPQGNFILVRDGLYAVYNRERCRLSDFIPCTFSCKWNYDNNKIEIYNEEYNISIFS